MDSRKKYADYTNYSKKVGRKQNDFACPKCREEILPKAFENHCAVRHGIDPKLACVWCLGEKSWPAREKNQNAKHLLECFEKFISPFETRAALAALDARKAAAAVAPKPTRYCTPLPLDEKLCPERDFFGHEADYIIDSLPAEALDGAFSLLPLDPPSLVYTDEHLNVAASCVEKYLRTRETHDWYHVMIRAVAYRSFLDALDDECGILPFSCWCDGGRHDEPRHRQHRHLVLVAPKGHFLTRIWPRVCAKDRPYPNYRCKWSQPLEKTEHLVNTLGYLSKRRSRCEFTIRNNKKIPTRDNHFYIFAALPKKFRLALAVLYEGGLHRYMYQDIFRNVSVESVVQYPLKLVSERWKQKIKHFYKLPRGIVLPLDRRYVPVDRETPHRAHLLGDKVLHFEVLPEPLDEEVWLERQIQGGNCFYEAVENEFWIPRPRDQKNLNLIVPRDCRIRELEVENSNLKREFEVQNLISCLKRKVEELETP